MVGANKGHLIACGVLIAPLFYAVVIAEMLTRKGFDITRHPLSLLSLGDAGWIQTSNFICSGLLAIVCAVGVLLKSQGQRAIGTWVAALIATFGIGMILAGLSPPDPLLGFPPGAAAGIPDHMSMHAVFHGVGFFVAFSSLTAACFVCARRFTLEHRPYWAAYSVASGLLTIALIVGGMAVQSVTSLAFFVVGIVSFGWLAMIAACEMRN